jgi:tRNA (Thr-GGU) A37 N-methylase
VFATRAPARPNPICMSAVKSIKIEGNIIHFSGADILDQTPLLDIKPYVPRFDHFEVTRWGWLQTSKSDKTTADDRFEK